MADDSRVIEEGCAYHVALDPALANEAQQQPPPRGAATKNIEHTPKIAGRDNFLWHEIGAVALATFLAAQEALESPDRP